MKTYMTSEAERRYRKRYYEKNREKILADQKKYRKEHREKITAYQKRYRMTHDRSEYQRQQYIKRKLAKA